MNEEEKMFVNVFKIMLRDFKIISKQYLLTIFGFITALTLAEVFGKMEFNNLKLLWVSFFYFILMQSNYRLAKFENIGLSLPIKRSDNVVASFLSYFILFSVSGFIISGLNRFLFNLGFLTDIHLITWEMGISNFISNIVLIGVFLPIMYKVGDYMKAMWISLLIASPILLTYEIMDKCGSRFLPTFSPSPSLLIGILVLAYFGSMLISIKLYNKREF